MKIRNVIPLLGLALGIAVFVVSSRASYATIGLEYAAYDAISGIDNGVNGAFSATTDTPRTFIGDVVNFYYPAGGPVTINAMDLGFAYRGAATTLSALNVNVVFYDSASISGNVLVSPLTSVVTIDVRQAIVDNYNATHSTNFTADTFVFTTGNYFYQVSLPTTVQFSDRSVNGIAINYAANSGSGLFSNDTLTSVLRVGPSIARGTKGFEDPRGGFLRNESGRTDYNFLQSDATKLTVATPGGTFVNNAGVAMRLYSTVAVVPEPGTLALATTAMGVSFIGVFVRRRKSHR